METELESIEPRRYSTGRELLQELDRFHMLMGPVITNIYNRVYDFCGKLDWKMQHGLEKWHKNKTKGNLNILKIDVKYYVEFVLHFRAYLPDPFRWLKEMEDLDLSIDEYVEFWLKERGVT